MRRILFALLLMGFAPARALADDLVAAPLPATASGAEEADVEKIKEKYWAKGDETEMGVVQNRLYPKRHRFELGVTGSSISGDPFLTTKALGGTLGFHFSEFFALHAVGWVASVGKSSALTSLESTLGVTADTNGLQNFYGGEARASVLYGKLSLLGSAILYFDAYFSAGAGLVKTESGNGTLFSAGVGQQIHLSRMFSINIDYKVMYYQETILGKNAGNLGQEVRRSSNLSSVITLGLSIFLDPFNAN